MDMYMGMSMCSLGLQSAYLVAHVHGNMDMYNMDMFMCSMCMCM